MENNNIEISTMEKRCYTVDELQLILMCGKATIYDLIKKKAFRSVKLGGSGYRISKKSFDEWFDRQPNTSPFEE